MDLTIKPEYIDDINRVSFESSENFIKVRGEYKSKVEFPYYCINYILVRNNTIHIIASDALSVLNVELDYNKFIHMFNDHRPDNKIAELSNKLDKVCAHIMTLMIAIEALPKDFDGEFP